jgi:hypothetical protein
MEIVRGKRPRAWFCVLYGTPAVGKTTLASKAPEPVFFDLEAGTDFLDVARVGVGESVTATLRELYKQRDQFKTLVIDSLTSLERATVRETCARNGWPNLEAPGFGKGKVAWRQDVANIITSLEAFRASGTNVLLVGHSKVRATTDPVAGESFDRLEFDADKEVVPSILAAVDGCFLLKQKTRYVEEGGKTRAVGNGSRVLITQDRPAYLAKSRFDIPESIENPGADFWNTLN